MINMDKTRFAMCYPNGNIHFAVIRSFYIFRLLTRSPPKKETSGLEIRY